MLGFSLTKLLFTVLVIAGVWYGFKWLGRLDKARRRKLAESGGADADRPGPVERAEEMEKCRVCGVFVAAQGARACGRGDCPYPG